MRFTGIVIYMKDSKKYKTYSTTGKRLGAPAFIQIKNDESELKHQFKSTFDFMLGTEFKYIGEFSTEEIQKNPIFNKYYFNGKFFIILNGAGAMSIIQGANKFETFRLIDVHKFGDTLVPASYNESTLGKEFDIDITVKGFWEIEEHISAKGININEIEIKYLRIPRCSRYENAILFK